MARSIVISIIGRPNVGKSTLFNRILRDAKSSITHDLPGVTRDRHYAMATLEEDYSQPAADAILVDTGGFYLEKFDIDNSVKKKNNYEPFFNLMAEHAKIAINESDLVLFVVDIREGLLPFDKMIADYIRSVKKKMWLVVNKYDSDKQAGEELEFYSLGISDEEMFVVSCEHNRGLSDLKVKLQHETLYFNQNNEEEREVQKGVKPNFDVVSSVAIVGAPNVGKSTLLNKLVGAKRALVSDIAGTTVDPIEGYIDLNFKSEAEKLKNQKDQFRKDSENFVLHYAKYIKENKPTKKDGLVNFDERQDMLDLKQDMRDFGVGHLHLGFEQEDDFDLSQLDEETQEELVEVINLGEDEEFSNDDEFAFDQEGQDIFDEEDMQESIEAQMQEDQDLEESSDEVLEEELSSEQVEVQVESAPVIDWKANYRSIKLVDTAGIRKSKHVEGFIETKSVYRSLKAISESDIVIYMVDATKGILHQDRRLIDLALEKGKSVIVALNKMDLMKETMNDPAKKREWMLDLRAQIPWLEFSELITISAKSGNHINRLIESVKKTVCIRHKKLGTGEINRFISEMIDTNPVILDKGGKTLKVKYVSMIKSSPPTFLLFSNKSKGIPENYRKYLTKGIRREFNIVNTPVHLIFRTGSEIAKRLKKNNFNQL